MRRQLLTMYTLIAASLLATGLVLLNCAELGFVYDNPCDKDGINYQGCEAVDPSSVTRGTFTDSRDGKVYNTVKIGTKTWFAENLNYDIPDNTSDVCYGNSSDNCAEYGRLYNWGTAMGGASSSNKAPSGVRGVCPVGWHLPSEFEWNILEANVGGSSTAGRKLKSTSGWYDCGPVGSGNSYVCEDAYGFSALPGGYGISDGYFDDAGYYGYWWSATEYDASYA